MVNMDCFRIVLRFICLLLIVASTWCFSQQTSKTSPDYVPPELQPSDPEVKEYLDSAEKSGGEGNYPESFQQLQKAFDLCARKGLVADKALIEAKIGAAYFVQGELEGAKQQWLSSFSDSVKTSNLVLQADTLVRLS